MLTGAGPKKRPRVPPTASTTKSPPSILFNDSSTADVTLRLFLDPPSTSPTPPSSTSSPPPPPPPPKTTTTLSPSPSQSNDVLIFLHSAALRRSRYFSALLSDRWQPDPPRPDRKLRLNFGVTPSTGSIETHVAVLKLLYHDPEHDPDPPVSSVATAVDLLPVALELLFEDLVRSCVTFLEAVPWSPDEERRVLNLIPLLRDEESTALVARLSPSAGGDPCEEMLHGLIVAAIHNHPNTAFEKAFVAKLLRDFSSRASARRVLERAFGTSLKIMKESLEEYSSPDFRGDHNETEAIQRLNLHTALMNGKHLLWLVERMIELRVADAAVREWGEQSSFTAELQKAFRDDAWRNIVPGLPAVVLRCTSKLASAVAAGTILAGRQVRMKLVKDWLPVLIVCKENVSPMLSSHKSLYLELEETFLRIISTLPMSDAQELLKQCLSFSTRNVDDCPHLVMAFNTWFRRATRPPKPDILGWQ